MKIELSSTNQIVLLNGVRTRRWVGLTENGNPIEVYSYQISSDTDKGIEECRKSLVRIDESSSEILITKTN